MSITTTPSPTQQAAQTFDRALTDLRSGVATATNAYAEMSEKAAKTGSDFRAFGKDTVDAFIEAGQVFATESQALLRDMTASGQAAATENLAGIRALLAAKTPKQQLELQANLVRTAAIHALNESSRFARAWIDLTEKAFAPIAARAYLVADKFTTTKA